MCANGHDSIFLSLAGSLKGLGNDLPNASKTLTFHLFADDTNTNCACKNLIDLELKLNHELIAVAEWMKSNLLALSLVKTSFILFHSKKLKSYKTFNLKINGVNIQQVSIVKYLGVTFDANLTWKSHIDELCLKLSKTVGIVSKMRYYVNIDVLKMLYNSLIYPFFTYGT